MDPSGGVSLSINIFIFNNCIMSRSPNLVQSDRLRRDVICLVLECLKDVQVEVRVKAAQVGYSQLRSDSKTPLH